MKVIRFSQFRMVAEAVNDTPEQYVKIVLHKLRNKIQKMFDQPAGQEVRRFGDREGAKGSLAELGIELESMELSRYSKTLDNLKVKFSDEEFLYDLMIAIDLREAMPNGEDQFEADDIKECYIKFKKYDKHEPGEVLAEIIDNVKIKDIDEDFMVSLKLRLDEESGEEEGEEFEIETGEEGEAGEEDK